MKDCLKMLAIGDIHYASGRRVAPTPERRSAYGVEFLKRVLRRFSDEEKPDVLVLPGDLLDDGREREARGDLLSIRKVLEESGIPAVSVPGNHEGDNAAFFSALGDTPGLHLVKNFIIYSFSDAYGENDSCSRREEDLDRFRSETGKHPGKKIIALQHNQVHPLIESAYPYNLANAGQVHRFYAENRVFLSISGHYHPGIDLASRNGVGYLTVPALCESPFRYLIIDIQGERIDVRTYSLKNPLPLSDNHCHSQFAYCAEDVTVEKVIERAVLLGMRYVCFTEHADQLYLTRKEYQNQVFFRNPGIIRKAREKGRDRVRAFREAVRTSGSVMARTGLEVVPDSSGGVTLLPEDREGLDLIIGAVHFLPEDFSSAPASRMQKAFMEAVEVLLKNDMAVLAHPFRIFVRNGLNPPAELFRPMAEMLKSYGVAAELNFHTNRPAPEFFDICLQEAIKVSLGTDTHNLLKAGEFNQHRRFLEMLGVSTEHLGEVLYLLP